MESFVPCRRVKLLGNCSHCLLMLFLTFCNIRKLHKGSGEAANSVSVCRQIPAYTSHAGRCPLRLFLKAVAVTRLAFVMPNGSDISFPKPQRLAFKLHYFTGKKKIRLTRSKTNVLLPSTVRVTELSWKLCSFIKPIGLLTITPSFN